MLFKTQIWTFLIGAWKDCEREDKAVHELQGQAVRSPFRKVSGAETLEAGRAVEGWGLVSVEQPCLSLP